MMQTVLNCYGAVVGVMTAVGILVRVVGLDKTKVGQVILTVGNDLLGLYQVFQAKKDAVQK